MSINDEDRDIIIRAIEAARHQPRLIDGTWWIWDFDSGKYFDSQGFASFEDSGVLNATLEGIVERIGTLESFAKGAPDRFLRKDVEDTARELTTFEKGLYSNLIRSRNYASGMAGSGFQIIHDENGSHLEVDYATFRKKAYFYELVIQQISHQGGILFFTPARLECSEVQITADGFKCFFDTKSGTVSNDFAVGDQARCQRFDLGMTTAKYYWRLVTEVGSDYIVLSLNDADAGSDQPQPGDLIVALGNRTDEARQAAKVTTVIGFNAPRDEYYEGINSYDLTGRLVTVVGVHEGKVGVFTENGAFSGSVTIGANSAGLENLAEWADKQSQINQAHATASEAALLAQEAADATKHLKETLESLNDDSVLSVSEKFSLRTEWEKINGLASLHNNGASGSYRSTLKTVEDLGYKQGENVIIQYGDFVLTFDGIRIVYNQTGLENFRLAYEALKEYFVSVRLYQNEPAERFNRQEAARLLTAYYDIQSELLSLAQKYHALTSSSLALENFVNTTYRENLEELKKSIDGKSETFRSAEDPSAAWADEESKKLHENDIWWNTSDRTINGVPSGATAIYVKSGDSYIWELAPVPKEVFDSIDGKAELFVSKPTSYNERDLWIVENDDVAPGFKAGTLLIASVSSDTFDASHWTKRDSYTDDTRANEAFELATSANQAAATAQQSAEAANDLAGLASLAAEEAISDANQALKDAEAAQDAAEAAKSAADAAAKDAVTANEALADIASDSKLTPTEKIQTKNRLQEISSEYNPNIELAEVYSVDSNEYKANYDTLIAYLTPLLQDITTTSDIDGDTFRSKFEGYYISRTNILNAISEASKALADSAQSDADQALKDAATAQAAAKAAQQYAEEVGKIANETKVLAEALESNKVGTNEYNAKVAALQALADEAGNLAGEAAALAATAAAAAETAKTAADQATATATSAAQTLASWSDDKVISPVEKSGVSDELAFITADKADIDNQKALYSVESEPELYTAYLNGYNAYKADLDAILATSGAVAVPEGMSEHQAAFYNARTAFLNAIAEAAKLVADKAQEAADTAQFAADAAQALADEAYKYADKLQVLINRLNDDSVLDVSEKFSLRTEWEKINGLASLVETGSTGSYGTALRTLEILGYSQGENVAITFNGQTIVYNGIRIVYNQTGLENFRLAYEALKEYFVSVRLYQDEPTENFNRQEAARLLTAYYDARSELLDNAQKYHALTASSQAIENFVNTTYKEGIEELKRSIDGKSETFRSAEDPSAAWTDEESRQLHENDIWWNTSDRTINGVPAGATAIYVKSGDSYIWELAPVPKEVFDSIDGKAEIFVSKPTSYNKNDVWILESSDVMPGRQAGSLLIASTSSDTFDANHWKEPLRYTDDAAAQAAAALAEAAAQAAQEAQGAANQAAATATSAAQTLASWSEDNVISPVEKSGVSDELSFIKADKKDIDNQITRYSISTSGNEYTAYQNGFNAYKADLDAILATSGAVAVPEGMSEHQAAFYNARTAILNAIAAAAKLVADKAQESAGEAAEEAEQAKLKAEEAYKYAEGLKELLEQIDDDSVLSVFEKKPIRTQWEMISGAASLVATGKNGSYPKAVEIAEALGMSAGQKSIITYNGYKLAYNGSVITYRVSGFATLETAFIHLRDYLSSIRLYQDENIEEFDRQEFASRITAYYAAEAAFMAAAQAAYTDDKVEDQSSLIAESLAESMGYDSFSSMEEAAKEGKTITVGGYINTALIKAKAIYADHIAAEAITADKIAAGAITAKHIAAEAITADKIKAKSLTAEQIDLVSLFAQFIQATNMEILQGCKIANVVVTKTGLRIDTEANGSVVIDESNGISTTAEMHFSGGTQMTHTSMGGCAGTAFSALAGSSYYLHCVTWNDKAIAIEAMADHDGAAFYSPKGMFVGLRPVIRNLGAPKYTETLTSLDHTVVIVSGSIYLPYDNIIGQESPVPLGHVLKIIHTTSQALTIYTYIAIRTLGSTTLTFELTSTKAEVIDLIYDGSNWFRY